MNLQNSESENLGEKQNPLTPIEIDISNANKIILPKLKFEISEDKTRNLDSDFEIISKRITHLKTINRPKGFKTYKTNDLKKLRFIRYSDFITDTHPYIKFDSEIIEYIQIPTEVPIAEYFSHFKQSLEKNAYLVCLPNQNLSLIDQNLNQISQFKSSDFCKDNYHLRSVGLNRALNLFCFSTVDKAYLLNQNFEIFRTFKVPYKDEFERRSIDKSSSVNTLFRKHLDILQLKYPAKQDEIKTAFRKLIYQYHPDRNPDSKVAEEKAKELISAYEYLSNQDISSTLDPKEEEYYWVNKKHSFETEINGVLIEINFFPAKPEDWIYGVGFSYNSSKIFLGCYSGKVYETNLSGKVDTIFLIPEDETCDRGGPTSPVNYILEIENVKYILTHYYLYIIENNTPINHIKCSDGKIRWFGAFIAKQLDKEIIFYDKLGDKIGAILLKTPIRHVCYNEGVLLIELTSKTLTFRINTS